MPDNQAPIGEVVNEKSLFEAAKNKSIFLDIINIVYGPRQAQYGESIDNHDRIANIANAIKPLDDHNYYSAATVARVLIAVKLSRLQSDPFHHDSHVDLLGYTEILYRIMERDRQMGDKNKKSEAQELWDNRIKREGGSKE